MSCYKEMKLKVACYCNACMLQRSTEKNDYNLMLDRELNRRGTFKDSPAAYWIHGAGRLYA